MFGINPLYPDHLMLYHCAKVLCRPMFNDIYVYFPVSLRYKKKSQKLVSLHTKYNRILTEIFLWDSKATLCSITTSDHMGRI